MDTSSNAVSAETGNMPQHSNTGLSESNGRRRKRRNSSVSSPADSAKRPSTRSVTRANTRTNSQISNEEHDTRNRNGDTPESSRKPKKRVRFSDPGPVRIEEGNSTGLTPAVRRTSLRGRESSSQHTGLATPSTPSNRSRRRCSAPTPGTTSSPSLASPSPRPWTQEFQFSTLRQQLDERTQRRIRRVGLSEEMNSIEQGKRVHMKQEREKLREKDLELAALKEELKAAKAVKSEDEEMGLHDGVGDGDSTAARRRIVELEAEVRRLKGEIATSGASQNDNDEPMSSYESTDTVLIGDSNPNDTILVSTTPDRQCHGDINSALIPSPSPTISANSGARGGVATPTTPDFQKEAEIFALSLDLESAKQEKRELFNEWRSHVSSGPIPSPNPSDISRLSSPPPDFLNKVTTTLRAALSRASDATLALDILREDLSGLGFPGPSTDDIIAEMRSGFREARIELERAVPGETPNASLDNGNATLHALVERIKSLVQDVKDGQERLAGSTDREKVLRGQFDTCLARYEEATSKIGKLEATIESTADDMLHSRMRIQELEKEGKDQAFGIERLNNALEKYREEIKELETLITTLESEHNSSTTASNKTIATLESKIHDEERARHEAESLAEEHRTSVNNLQETLAQNNTQITTLTSTVTSLTKERDSIVAEMERKTTEQAEQHDRQVGGLNVKLGELTTSLADANSRVEKLRDANIKLEHRVSVEADAFMRATEAIQAENMRSFARIKEMTSSSLRGVKVRKANAELEDGDDDGDCGRNADANDNGGKRRRKTASFAPIGSEPITPSSGGSRFVDVEVGRGKKRKRLDSGIGILEEQDEEEEEGDSGIGRVEMCA